MPDPFRQYQPGDAVTFSTRAMNAMTQAGKLGQRQRHNVRANAREQFRQADIIKVKNETGGPQNRFAVLGLREPIFLPTDSLAAFLREPTFRVGVPDATSVGKFCILLDPLDTERIGRAYVSGVCLAKVNVVDPTHQFADVTINDTGTLASGTSGAAQLLWTEGEEPYGDDYNDYYADEGYAYEDGYSYGYGTGVQRAVIRLGSGAASGATSPAVASGAISARSGQTPGKGKILLETYDGTSMVTDSTTQTDVLNNYTGTNGVVPSGATCKVSRDAQGNWWIDSWSC